MRSDNDTWDITTSVGSTALFAAAARALEAQRPEPLARDPHAEIYCRAAGGEWADVVEGKATSSRSKLLLETEFGKHFVSFQALGPGAVAGVCEVGSGLNDKRPTLRQILSDPSATVVGVGHRDRLARFGVEYLEAALSAQGRRVVVADLGETAEDLVRDVIEVLTSMCTRSYGRRGARNRAMRALTAARRERGDG